MDYQAEIVARASWITELLRTSGCQGIVLGLSGGKDSSVVATLCKRATDNVLGVIMPCSSLASDSNDALRLAAAIGLETISIDLSAVMNLHLSAISEACGEVTALAASNMKPRLRMTTLYTIAQNRRALVAGTSNRSERCMGYFTKWGDGASDFNPIADLTVSEVLRLGEALGVEHDLLYKTPSAGLFVGQTDEAEMGVSYKAIDSYLLQGADTITNEERAIIERASRISEHKRRPIPTYREI